MKDKKIIITLSIIIVLVLTIGVTYAFYTYTNIGKNQVLISGDIYLNYQETNEIRLENAIPLSKEEALIQTNNSFKFTITGKNTSNKDIYYAISVVEGDSIENKSRIKPSDINLYLKENEEVVVDGLRYESFDNTNIWINKIPAKTNNQVVINYELKMWIDSGVKIGNASDSNYSLEDWNNSYQSIKVNVNANLSAMNLPIVVEPDQVENNKSYFIATIRNYDNPDEEGEILDVADKMNLAINNENNNVLFTYKDSLGNEDTEKKQSLNLEYDFTKKQSVAVQVYMESVNDANQDADVIVKSTKNNDEVYSLVKKMSIKGNNYCLNNGFNKLSDCILVSENMSSSVEDAKTFINNKGSVNLNDTAPTYTYVEDITTNVNNAYTSLSGYKYYFGTGYEFNSITGTFKLTGNIITDNLSDTYINYYTCGGTYAGNSGCSTIYKILGIDNENYKITLADKITYKVASTLKSEQGLYRTEDDYGTSYFYRGDVKNNNVYFAGYYWKIIRMNGDGSIRMIYNGTTPNATGDYTSVNNKKYQYNSRCTNPTYVGYMHGENFALQISNETNYQDIIAGMKYYFADNYTFDEATKTFSLSGNIISDGKTFSEMNSLKNEGFSRYPYTCRSTYSNGKCQVLIKVNSYVSEINVKAQYISYSSTSLDATRKDDVDSNAKKSLDDWYLKNIVEKTDNSENSLTSYIVDGSFCNERNFYSGNGYSLVPTTTYSAYRRLYENANKSATLKCGNINDTFSTTKSKGNAKLKYPVALISADEVAFAGGKHGMKNQDYYLRTNGFFWTMTPAFFSANYVSASVYNVYSSGMLWNWNYATDSYGLRAVINLRSDVLIYHGDGTINNPFMLTLNTRVINE